MVKETDRKNKELFLGVKIFYFCGSKLANLEARKKLRANTKTSEGNFAEDIKKGQRKSSSAPIRLVPLVSKHVIRARTAYHSGISCDGACPQYYEKHSHSANRAGRGVWGDDSLESP